MPLPARRFAMTDPIRRTGSAIDEHAAASLAFIRTTIERSAAFTAVPGRGGVAMGAVGVLAAVIGRRQASDASWLAVWIAAAVVALPLGLLAMRWKARRHGVILWSANARRCALGFAPAVLAAAVLTAALVRAGRFDLLPAVWLLLYGVGIVAGSTASIASLAWLGAGFMTLGAGAAAAGGAWRDAWLGAGFGGLQVIFGVFVARRHGG